MRPATNSQLYGRHVWDPSPQQADVLEGECDTRPSERNGEGGRHVRDGVVVGQ